MRYLSALLITVFANGCFFLPSWGGYDDDDWTYYEDVHEIDGQIEDAWLAGDMNDLGEFEGDAYEATYSGYSGSSNITLHAGAAGGDDFGWAMVGLSTGEPGGFEGDEFEPGRRLDTENGDDLSAQGCTGARHGDWEFDGYADRVEVTVEEGPELNSRLIHFRATYEGEGVTEGSFVLVLEGDTAPGGGVVDG